MVTGFTEKCSRAKKNSSQEYWLLAEADKINITVTFIPLYIAFGGGGTAGIIVYHTRDENKTTHDLLFIQLKNADAVVLALGTLTTL